RTLEIHSRPHPAPAEPGEPSWTRHATGHLGTARSGDSGHPGAQEPDGSVDAGAPRSGDTHPVGGHPGAPRCEDGGAPDRTLAQWPPAGATPLDLTTAYPALAATGYHYGPHFQGLTAAWRTDDALYAEVRLPAELHPDAGAFALHPALLDAALHPLVLTQTDGSPTAPRIPFSLARVRLHATGATVLRVRLITAPDGTTALTAADTTGAPVLTLGSLTLRE
ncbi:polyketide synthase dehydratase domain-containing protein, partial [Streptomyces palmae]